MRMFLFTNAGTLLAVPNVLVFHFGPLHFRRALPRHSARPDHGDREEGSIEWHRNIRRWMTNTTRKKQATGCCYCWLARWCLRRFFNRSFFYHSFSSSATYTQARATSCKCSRFIKWLKSLSSGLCSLRPLPLTHAHTRFALVHGCQVQHEFSIFRSS